jgi:hypothetical protein
MAFLGNIFLGLSTIIVFMLNVGALSKEPPRNDGAVGYVWTVIYLNLALIALMILVALIIGYKGGFDWVAAKRSSRFWIVTIVLLTALITTALSSLFRFEHGPVPGLIRLYSHFVPLVVPVILVVTGFILINSTLREAVPVNAYKWPLMLVGVIGVSGTLAAAAGFLMEASRNQAARREAYTERDKANHQRMLAEIDSNDVTKNFVFLLVFTGDNQDPEIRERGVAKVKTHPQWQQELIRLLQTDWAPEPFQFLASNVVDDPSLFPEAVREGVLIQARLIRESIRNSSHPSHFYESRYSWEVERVIRTVDRYKNMGVDFVPAMRELRSALDEKAIVEKPKFESIPRLEAWIKENS